MVRSGHGPQAEERWNESRGRRTVEEKSTTTQADLSHGAMCHDCASMNGAQCAQYCVLCTSMCAMVFMLFIALCSSMMLLCVKLYAMS